jgi:hypothetical protein
MQMRCFGCLAQLLNNSRKTLNNYKSKTYLNKKIYAITVISYEN